MKLLLKNQGTEELMFGVNEFGFYSFYLTKDCGMFKDKEMKQILDEDHYLLLQKLKVLDLGEWI